VRAIGAFRLRYDVVENTTAPVIRREKSESSRWRVLDFFLAPPADLTARGISGELFLISQWRHSALHDSIAPVFSESGLIINASALDGRPRSRSRKVSPLESSAFSVFDQGITDGAFHWYYNC
jgi:hypothetical protein